MRVVREFSEQEKLLFAEELSKKTDEDLSLMHANLLLEREKYMSPEYYEDIAIVNFKIEILGYAMEEREVAEIEIDLDSVSVDVISSIIEQYEKLNSMAISDPSYVKAKEFILSWVRDLDQNINVEAIVLWMDECDKEGYFPFLEHGLTLDQNKVRQNEIFSYIQSIFELLAENMRKLPPKNRKECMVVSFRDRITGDDLDDDVVPDVLQDKGNSPVSTQMFSLSAVSSPTGSLPQAGSVSLSDRRSQSSARIDEGDGSFFAYVESSGNSPDEKSSLVSRIASNRQGFFQPCVVAGPAATAAESEYAPVKT